MDLLSELGYRKDGRQSNQIRNISCRLGVYSQADGSAYLEQGNTKILAAVYGPHEPKQRGRIIEDRCLINCQYSMATFSTVERKHRPRGDRKSMELTRLLEKTFNSVVLTDLYPRSQIDIFCEVLQTDGSNLAACINAASLALVDAGVPLRNVVTATCVGLNAGDRPVVDLNADEEQSDGARLTVAILPGHSDVKDDFVLVELDHRTHYSHLDSMLDAAVQAAHQMHVCLQTAIRKHVTSVAICLR